MRFLLLIVVAGSCFGAVTNLQVMGATSTQIVISYTAPTTAACTVEASKESDYTPLVLDVDPALFAGSNSDNRAGSVTNGRHRIFVIGNQGPAAIADDANGWRRSRALQTDTTYYIRTTCGGDQATITARTANISLGDTRGEPLAVHPTEPWTYLSANDAGTGELTDPFTGIRIMTPKAMYGYGYGGSTSNNWSPGGGADCNQTLAGVLGSCKFAEASGAGWTATTGTLTDAIRTDDTNYAEYSGTTQQPLYIRLGSGKYPTSSTLEEVGAWAFQNIIQRGLTTDATAGGGDIDLCITEGTTSAAPPTCISPWFRHSLTGSEATVRFCKDVPCSVPDDPGDLMVNTYPGGYRMAVNARMYNEVGSETTLKFAGSGAADFCNSLFVGEPIQALDDGNAERWTAVSTKSCGSSPPQITIAQTYNYKHAGTSGVAVFTQRHPEYNPRYGILIRKASTTSSSTIKIGYALWRTARSTPFSFALGSGGFGKRCQNVLTAQGKYLCHFGKHIVGISYNADGALNLTNYGYTYVNGDYINSTFLIAFGTYGCMGDQSSNDSMWDDTTAGVFYCYLSSKYNNPLLGGVDNRPVMVKLTLNTTAGLAAGDPDAASGPGVGNKAQRLVFTAHSILTPCTGVDDTARLACSSTSNDYTPFGQRKRYAPTWDHTKFGSCAIQSVQGVYIIEWCFAGSQDTAAWMFVYDTSIAVDSQQIIAGFMVPGGQACRWCSLHTFQAPIQTGGAEYTVVETSPKCPFSVTATSSLPLCSSVGSGTCTACPNVTLNNFSYNGLNWCSNLTVTSAWNGGWGTQPGAFADGDPVSAGCADSPGLHWIQTLAVGDYLTHGGEIVRIVEKLSNTSYTVARGVGSNTTDASAAFWAGRAHSNSVTWEARCGAIRPDPNSVRPELTVAAAWWFLLDPTGSNEAYTYTDEFQNHGLHAGVGTNGIAVQPAYNVGIFDSSSASSLKAISNTVLSLPSKFSGIDTTTCSGNGCERHPAYSQILGDANARASFVDVHPRLSHGGQGANGVALVAGKTYIYKWQGDINVNPKHFDLEAYSALFPFRRVDTLTDSVADTGKFCWAVVNNDCFSGSVAGEIYTINESFDTFYITASACREAEFGSINGDTCLGNSNSVSASVTQWRLPSSGGQQWLNGSAHRVVSKYARTYRESATENFKIDPLGKVLFPRGSFYLIPPPFPGLSSRSGETWASIKIDLPSVPAGTNNALIEFGYNSSFQCSKNRDESCYAESATLNQTTPYRFSHETLTGVSCASNCTITIPALHSRVLYWRVKYRNAGGAVIATGSTNVQATQ